MRDGSGLSSRVGVAFFLGLLLCLAIPAGVLAQGSNSGTIVGVVTDQSGGVVVGAAVTLTDTSTNSSRKTTTNDAGRYVFVNVSPSTYNISVTREGFSVAKISNQYVKIGQQTTINVTLQVGAASQTVEVTAVAGSELQTMNATVGTTISGAQLLSLPNIGRDASTLATLQPAVTPSGQVAGAVSDQNTFQLDGGNNSNDMDGTMNIYTPSYASNGAPTGVMPTPVESIEEFKVSTNNQTADFNGSAGMQVQMATKRGSDQWHGSAYEYYFSTQFSANSWSNNRNGIALPLTHRNRFGASAGGQVLPSYFGGKTYFFANYEGFRFPQATTITKTVPTALMRAGIIQVADDKGNYIPYNLNPAAVTVGGITYPAQNAACGTGGTAAAPTPLNLPCDPRGLGISPTIATLWSKFMPLPNVPTAGDTQNTQGYNSSIGIPQSSDFGVVRLDHDFGQKWHFMASYRVYKFSQLTTSQVDIGGAISGDTFGQATALAPRPQKPSYYVAGMTTNITPNLTNDFHYDYLRNFWQWVTQAAPPQLPGLGGALEIGGESTNALIPYNVNTQSARQRFWDGQDNLFRDDLSLLHGNHLFQFGGLYQRNFNFHTRNDNGNGIMNATVYQITIGPGLAFDNTTRPELCPNPTPASGPVGNCLPTNSTGTWDTLYSEVLGIVAQPQTLYTRSGPQLTLQPLGTPMFDQSVIPTYNLYFSDTWHMKPTFTLTYGMGYQVEMPPFEQNGKQVELVDASGNLVNTTDYLAQRQKAALAGQVYNPTLGFATVTNVGSGLKYPYNPFYKGFSPRVSVAWAPNYDNGILGKAFGHGKSVVRLGYNRIFGRLNGVDLVLVPLLGTGLGQALQCQGALSPAAATAAGSNCNGPGTANATTAFRIGPTTSGWDGLTAPLPSVGNTLPQPYYPGVGGNASAGDGEVLDPNFRPNVSDEVDLTIQREISSKMRVEAGYIGRRIQNEYQAHDLDSVPYMTTLGGQTFAQAYANLYTELGAGSAIQVQPWFEAAMGGASSAFCSQTNKSTSTPYTSCTAAVAGTQASNITGTLVYSLWSALSNPSATGPGKGSWTLGRTLPSSAPGSQLSSIFMNDSLGYGNYHAAFVSFTARDWHGLSAVSNFTWSRTMGTGAVTQSTSGYSVVDPWNINAMYGPQSFDIRFLYNLTMIYQAPYFTSQQGLVGHILGGWTFAPLFTAQSGGPLGVSQGFQVNSSCQAFGEMNCSSGGTNENAVLIAPFTGGSSAHQNIVVSSGNIGVNTNPKKNGSGINMFTDPAAVYAEFGRLVLGIDQNGGGAGQLRGLRSWNLDMTATKDIKFSERFGLMFSAQFTNVLNHFQPSNPSLNLDNQTTWGYINGQANTPRQMEFGLRFHF